ncbi:glycosyltransferase family 4 protein [Flavobacterium sp. KACC 22761]|uniref:glycosyltransferase family 4 protein n=1 Tax=Flavobacterium sp. KACC 22761 TaxID=3092665 RepID=UPI002A74B416|nr:glycosyltransferase family 4 protein [Flavobacterium sp. KACC 22761]WPO77438.1 glycosyltransferase family 4 protein [Flavobacterium sp. KACC 22761]
MKVLHISGAKAWGGNEQQLVYCIPQLNKLEIENVVFGIKDTVLEKLCLENNISFIPTKNRKLVKFSNYKQFKELVKDIKPDLIHLHTSNSLTFYVLSNLLLRLNIKVVFSKKAISASSSFISKFKYNSKVIDAVFCVSNAVKNNFAQVLSPSNNEKLMVVPDCVSLEILDKKANINLREKYNIDESKFLIGNIANHTEAKDLETFVNAADYLVNVLNRKDLVFFQIGDFTKRTDAYLKLVAEKKLQDYVIFTDTIEDACVLNKEFDVFLMTSQREGGPTSVLEAMLMGVPVVSTNIGIVPEVIINGENGFICPIKDFKSLGDNVNLLLNDENLRGSFAEKGKIAVEKGFIAPVIARKTAEAYTIVINS